MTSSSAKSGDCEPGYDLKYISDYITSLYKKDLLVKPKCFNRNSSIKSHLRAVEKYTSAVGISDELGKICILLESLDSATKSQLLFEEDYDENSYSWHKNKLIQLLPDKMCKTSALTDLFHVKQSGLSFNDFALKIKQELMDRSDIISKETRSSIAKDIFLNGLDDPILAEAVKTQKPLSIDEAFNCVRNLQRCESQNVNANVAALGRSPRDSAIADLQKQVAYLTQLVLALKSSLQSQPPAPIRKRYEPQKKLTQPCRICKKNNHDTDQCWFKNKNQNANSCYICGEHGHYSRTCPKNKRHIRQMQEETSENTSMGDSDIPSLPVEEYANCIQEGKDWILVQPKRKKRAFKPPKTIFRPKQYSKEIEHDYNYIMGRSKENSYGFSSQAAMTIHKKSQLHHDNKPTVAARVNGVSTHAFLDTGSEINVVDKQFAINRLGVTEQQFSDSKKKIKCANGSSMNICGSTQLNVQLGVSQMQLSFIVADKVSPHFIVGIRGLKSLQTSIDPERSAAIVQGVELPFINKIEADSLQQSKNGFPLYQRIGVQG